MKIKYRPEIDGLRAIAVIAVIFYHAQFKLFGYDLFKGGFLGVDIFFVISGYLITSLILKELNSTGKFNFIYFYERRVRRILPVFLLVMLVSLPFAWMFLLPLNLIDFSKTILYSLGFSSNFYFYFSGTQYGDTHQLLKPFLHAWSLSVEEQYYVFFPIICYCIFKYFKTFLLPILIIGFLLSLFLAQWTSYNMDPLLSFYMLPTRGWELLAGSILSYLEIKKSIQLNYKFFNKILPILGLSIIILSFIFFDKELHYPSFFTIASIFGICLLIWFSNKDEFITKILSSKYFVGIGLISYSLYLWHYPLFAFARILGISENQNSIKCFLILISVLLSIASYFFVEKTFRRKINKINISKYLLSFFIIIISLNILFIEKKGYASRLPEIFSNKSHIRLRDELRDDKGMCFHRKNNFCNFNPNSKKKVLLIGDSLMGSLAFDMKKRLVKKDYNFKTMMIGSCYYLPDFKNKRCDLEYQNRLREEIFKDETSIIIIGGWLTNLLDSKSDPYINPSMSIQEGIISSINELLKKDYKVILIYPTPEFNVDVPRYLFNMYRINLAFVDKKKVQEKIEKNLISIDYKKNFLITNEKVFKLYDHIQHDNLFRIYPHKLFCNTELKNKCIANNSKNFFYSDEVHLSLKGSEIVNDLIIKKIEEIMPR